MRVHICCRNWQDDRVIPRFSRHLMEQLGWTVGKTADPKADANYLLAYFEYQLNEGFDETPVVAYMTHRDSKDSAKTALYDDAARIANLRIAMNAAQLPYLKKFGPALQIPLPLELDHFRLVDRPKHHIPVVGVSGYTYQGGRKGEDLVAQLSASPLGRRLELTASGRGWPCVVTSYSWVDMPKFFRGLDVYLCVASIEGGPMTTLEALATGCPVVIPRGVGLHDELPNMHGIYRYERDNYAAMEKVLETCLSELGTHDSEALRKATRPHSVEAWVDGNSHAIENFLYDQPPVGKLPAWYKHCGIYMVAFGAPSRKCAKHAIAQVKKVMPGMPVALCSTEKVGGEDVFVQQPDSDIGGRIAKLRVYDLAPKEWQYIIYMDADTECRESVTFLFDLLTVGWEFVICKDVRREALMRDFKRPNNIAEYDYTIDLLGTTEALQLNGGVWSFRRCDRTKAFFERWYEEWDRYGGRDQGALVRALHARPLRMVVLNNEWNYFPDYCKEEKPGAIFHYPQRARRWRGQIEGRLDGQRAWTAVNQWEATQG